MTIFRIVAVGLISLMGFNISDKRTDENQFSAKREEKDAIKKNSVETQDVLLENLDVDQFQEQHGMLVATNHVT